MELEGKVIFDLPEIGGVSKAGNNWRKKEYVIETQSQWPRKVKVYFFNDRIDSNRLELNKIYAINIEVESREFNGRWYTDVQGLSAREVGQSASVSAEPAANFGQPAAAPADLGTPSSTDDLPF